MRSKSRPFSIFLLVVWHLQKTPDGLTVAIKAEDWMAYAETDVT